MALLVTVGVVVEAEATERVFLPQYVDWTLTTPLLIRFLGLLSGAPRRIVGLAVGVDVLILLLGTAGTLTTGRIRYVMFGTGAVALLGLLHLLYRPMTVAGRGSADAALFGKLRDVVGVLLLVYPIVWLSGASGLGL